MTSIMKGFLAISAFLLIPVALFAYTSPGKPTGFVNDFARILTTEDAQNISAKLQALNRETGFEVAVVTISTLNGDTVENYANKLFQEWGIGGAEKDTGLLLLVAIEDREVRIETGYGAEGAVTDIQSGNIIRDVMTPAFREGNYGTGISGAVDALGLIITNSPEAAQYSVDSGDADSASKNNINPFALFFVVIFVLNGLARLLGKTKSWWLGGVIGGVIGAVIGLIWGFLYFGIGSIVILTVLGLLFDFIVSKRPPGSGGHGGGFWPIFFGGGHGGGSSGGGFGGFGGGMSGGGGASGRW